MEVHGTVEGFEAWLKARGHATLDAGSLTPAMLLQRATDYLEAVYGPRLSGVEESIALSSALERATYAAALHEARNPGSLSAAVTASSSVKREKVDTLEVEYFEGSGDAIADATVKISGVEGLLSPFFYVPLPAVFVV